MRAWLTVMILRGSEFINLETFGTSDPFTRVTLLQPDGTSQQQKTTTVDGSLTPEWNQQFEFESNDVQPKNGAKLVLEVLDEDVTTDTAMGKTEILLSEVALQGGAEQQVKLVGEGGGVLHYWAKWEAGTDTEEVQPASQATSEKTAAAKALKQALETAETKPAAPAGGTAT